MSTKFERITLLQSPVRGVDDELIAAAIAYGFTNIFQEQSKNDANCEKVRIHAKRRRSVVIAHHNGQWEVRSYGWSIWGYPNSTFLSDAAKYLCRNRSKLSIDAACNEIKSALKQAFRACRPGAEEILRKRIHACHQLETI